MNAPTLALCCALATAAACGDSQSTADAGAPDAETMPAAGQDWTRDILSTSLDVDVSAQVAKATITLAAAPSTAASFEIGDLVITSVDSPTGPLSFEVRDAQIDIGVPSTGDDAVIEIRYSYTRHSDFTGIGSRYTLIWPYYCGNMFPCKSDPAEGLTFELSLAGVELGKTAVFPRTIPGESSSYMIAWAIGDYTYETLGTTTAGTEVGVWYLDGGQANALAGTASLTAVFDWFETTYGAYIFGDKVASVAAQWGPGAFGGMEHHPLWHVATIAMADEETHVHEAAHGWFGNGIRIKCWEDFVMSEGTVSYLTARGLAEIGGQAVGDATWTSYQARLDALQAGANVKIAWPDSCGVVDIIEDGLFSDAPYMKGAFFFRAVEKRVGIAALDAALTAFYAQYVGRAAGMQDLLDTIMAETGYDANACALAWLRSNDVPASDTCPQ